MFGSEHSIHNITISGDHYATIVSNRKSPIAVAHDLQSGHVYWTDILEGKIQRSRLLGNGTVETVVDKVEHSNGMVFFIS